MPNRAPISSNAITSSAAVATVGVILYDITLQVGTTQSIASIRNGGSTGTIAWEISNVAATTAKDTTVSKHFPKGLVLASGLYVTISGTNAQAWVTYENLQ